MTYTSKSSTPHQYTSTTVRYLGQIKAAVEYGSGLESVRRQLGIPQGKMYALKDKQGNIISNFGDIERAAEEFYTDLYSTVIKQARCIGISDDEATEVPSKTCDEVKMALQAMNRGKRQEKMEQPSI